jgi:hypothetical protein
LAGNPERKSLLGKPSLRWEDDIKMNSKQERTEN